MPKPDCKSSRAAATLDEMFKEARRARLRLLRRGKVGVTLMTSQTLGFGVMVIVGRQNLSNVVADWLAGETPPYPWNAGTPDLDD